MYWQSLRKSVRLLAVVLIAGLICVVLLFWAHRWGSYTINVYRGKMWIHNSTNGSIAGPFEVGDVPGGVFGLTGCDKLPFGQVVFRDETVLPGRVRIKISDAEYDIMQSSVVVNGVRHEWNYPHCP
jgi:hypothetical protein